MIKQLVQLMVIFLPHGFKYVQVATDLSRFEFDRFRVTVVLNLHCQIYSLSK